MLMQVDERWFLIIYKSTKYIPKYMIEIFKYTVVRIPGNRCTWQK